MNILSEAIKAATDHLLATARDPYGWLSDMRVTETDPKLDIVEIGACGTIDVAQAVEEVLLATLPRVQAETLQEAADFLETDQGGNSASYKLRIRAANIAEGKNL